MPLLVITHVPYRGFIAEVYAFQIWVKKEFTQKFYSVKTLHETPTNRFNENIGKHALLLFHFSQNKITKRGIINSFRATGSLLYPLKNSENL